MLRTFRDLIAWQKGFALARHVYQLTSRFPRDERFGLTAQIRRAAVSVPSNIAEGYARGTRPDYIRFLWMANGSLAELQTRLLLAAELGFARTNDLAPVASLVEEEGRILPALIESLQEKSAQ